LSASIFSARFFTAGHAGHGVTKRDKCELIFRSQTGADKVYYPRILPLCAGYEVSKRDISDLTFCSQTVADEIRLLIQEFQYCVQGMEGMGGMEMFKRDEMMAKMGMGGDDDDDDDDEDEFTSVSIHTFPLFRLPRFPSPCRTYRTGRSI
jgi:hypothetical protein